jgi:arogenate dehydrogenase (NADP+)
MRVGIVGLGLIGGSLALGLRRLGRAIEVTGVTRRAESAAEAIERGAVDRASTELADLSDCEIVVIATPIEEIGGVMERLGPIVAAGTLITDVASVKRPVLAWAKHLPNPSRFLGGHPVAGKTRSGLGEIDAGLFDHEPWIFTPAEGQDVRPFDTWFEMVRAIGSTVSFMRADLHDRQMAYLSHLAFVVSSAFAETVQKSADAALGGPGYRSMVRLAGGDPAMYEAIARENRDALIDAIDRFDAILHRYRQRIEGGTRVKELFGGAIHATR